MKFIEFVKTASDEELIKTAEALRVSLERTVQDAIIPVMEKLAEQIQDQIQAAPAASEGEAATAAAMAPSAGVPQGASNLQVAVAQNVLDKKAMEAAIKETIYSNNIAGLQKIVQGVAQAHGPQLAEAAISVARQIMQEGLVAGDLQAEQLAALAEAFKSFDGATNG